MESIAIKLKERVHIYSLLLRSKILCPICYHPPNKLVYFSNFYNHSYCEPCLQQLISHELKKFKLFQCCQDKCKQVLTKNSEHYSKLQSEQRKRYDKILNQHQILKYSDRRVCPKEGCNGYIITDKIPVKCVSDDSIIQLRAIYPTCKKCKSTFQKISGCNHLTCRCGNQFCYSCKNAWTANHVCPPPSPQPKKPSRNNNPPKLNQSITSNYSSNNIILPKDNHRNLKRQRQQDDNQRCISGVKILLLILLYMPYLFLVDLLVLTAGEIIAFLCMILAQIACSYIFYFKEYCCDYNQGSNGCWIMLKEQSRLLLSVLNYLRYDLHSQQVQKWLQLLKTINSVIKYLNNLYRQLLANIAQVSFSKRYTIWIGLAFLPILPIFVQFNVEYRRQRNQRIDRYWSKVFNALLTFPCYQFFFKMSRK